MASNPTPLIIDELRQIASTPNGYDPKVLAQIQENIACDVVRLYRDDLKRLMDKQKADGTPAPVVEQERRDFFAQKLNQEYRSRVMNGKGFSLPLYVETAENTYRMDIRRQLQKIQDCVAQAYHVAEMHQAMSIREVRGIDGGVNDLMHDIARCNNDLSTRFEQLSRLRSRTADQASNNLKAELANGMKALQSNKFSSSVLEEAQNLAAVDKEMRRFEPENSRPALR